MSTRVEQRKRETRARILRAALELFAEKGVEATTVAEISEAADIGKGTFFTYFRTKEEVFADIGSLMFEMMREEVGLHAGGRTARAQLTHLMVPAMEWHQKHPALSRLSVTVLMRSPSAIDADAANISALETLIAELVKAGQASGELRGEADPEAAAAAILGLYFMCLHRWHRGGATGALMDPFRRGLDVVLKGLVK